MIQKTSNLYELHYQSGGAGYRLVIDADARKLLVAQRKYTGAFVDVSVQVHKMLQQTLIDFGELLHAPSKAGAVVLDKLPRWAYSSADFHAQQALA